MEPAAFDLRHRQTPSARVGDLAVSTRLRPQVEHRFECERDDGGNEDRVEDRGAHAPCVEDEQQQERDREQQHRPAGNRPALAQFKRCAAGVADEAGVDHPDERNEEADAHTDCGFQLAGHRVEDRGAETGDHQQKKNNAFNDHQAHRIGPRHTWNDNNPERHERAHAQS